MYGSLTRVFFPNPHIRTHQSVVPLIQRNIDLNIPPSTSKNDPAATAAGYAWGESKAALGGADRTFDSILMADVVYDPKYYSALVKALRDLSHAGTVVTLAHRERHPDAALFFEVRVWEWVWRWVLSYLFEDRALIEGCVVSHTITGGAPVFQRGRSALQPAGGKRPAAAGAKGRGRRATCLCRRAHL